MLHMDSSRAQNYLATRQESWIGLNTETRLHTLALPGHTSASFALAFLSGTALAGAVYTLNDNIVGEGFYSSFNFEAIPDPTNGRVTYVDQPTAQMLNLTYATSNTFIMRADDTTVLTPSGPGRNSVRIRSNSQYTQHVVV